MSPTAPSSGHNAPEARHTIDRTGTARHDSRRHTCGKSLWRLGIGTADTRLPATLSRPEIARTCSEAPPETSGSASLHLHHRPRNAGARHPLRLPRITCLNRHDVGQWKCPAVRSRTGLPLRDREMRLGPPIRYPSPHADRSHSLSLEIARRRDDSASSFANLSPR